MESLLKFNHMVKNSLLDPSDPKYKPLYLANDFDRENRGIKKYLRKFNWFDPSENESDFSWKNEIPPSIRPKPQKKGRRKQLESRRAPSSVLFVPNTNGAVLLRRLEHLEDKLEKMTGYRVRMVEAAGRRHPPL